MPRTGRKNLHTTYFHIIVQGINKEYIFNNELFMEKYQALIFYNLKKFDLNLIAYCIMNNHTHLLIHVEDISQLSKFMQNVNTSFSKYYNDKNNRVGIVFRSRYKSEPIYDNKYLVNCMAYIHNNPVKARIVDIPGEYKYSSYNDYINGKIDEKSKKMIFTTNENFLNNFIKTHQAEEDIKFEDFIEDIDYDKKIKELLTKNIGEIILDEELLKKVIKDLIEQKIPIKKICEIFKMTRYKISKLL